jgi:hypothetical protein
MQADEDNQIQPVCGGKSCANAAGSKFMKQPLLFLGL